MWDLTKPDSLKSSEKDINGFLVVIIPKFSYPFVKPGLEG